MPQKDELCRELWFEFSEIISVTGKIDKPVENKDKFMVDADVSRKRQLKSEPKELQRWTDDGDFTMKELSGSLETESVGGRCCVPPAPLPALPTSALHVKHIVCAKFSCAAPSPILPLRVSSVAARIAAWCELWRGRPDGG
eukprot:sb/3474271/